MADLSIASLQGRSGSRQIGVPAAVLNELAAFADADRMLRRAVELAREVLGLERVSFYLRDPRREAPRMHGTWGTGLSGQTTDEHDMSHPCARADIERLQRLPTSGTPWQYSDGVPFGADGSRLRWLGITPLVAAGAVVGVMYNDAALSEASPDVDKQMRAALLCNALAEFLSSRRGSLRWPWASRAPKLRLEYLLRRIREDVHVSSDELARELEITPPYLARSFRAQTGMSLVEYRNRQMLKRFFVLVAQRESKLMAAALEAGFKSYTHFARVHRKLLGSTATARLSQLEAAGGLVSALELTGDSTHAPSLARE